MLTNKRNVLSGNDLILITYSVNDIIPMGLHEFNVLHHGLNLEYMINKKIINMISLGSIGLNKYSRETSSGNLRD